MYFPLAQLSELINSSQFQCWHWFRDSWRPFQLSGISGMKIQLILETFQVKCAFQMASPPTTLTYTRMHTLPPSQTWAMAFPKLGIQCLMCFLLTMPMWKQNVPCVLCPVCPGGVEWHVKHATAPIWAALLAITLLSFTGNIDYCCCGQRSFPRIWYSLRSGPTAGPLTLCHDHKR